MAKKKNITSAIAGKDWKQIEKLIAKIEEHYCEKATVKSPDFIPNVFTGSLIEVDVSIRYNIGSADALMIIECRDRSRKQDVMWIRELYGKKKDVGASVLMGVSTKGFTKEAILNAKLHGIVLRKLDKIDPATILEYSWMLSRQNYNIYTVQISFVDSDKEMGRMVRGEIEKLNGDITLAEILYSFKLGKSVSILNIFHDGLNSKRSDLDEIKVPDNGRSQNIFLEIEFPDSDVCIKYSGGDAYVKSVRVEFYFYKTPAEKLKPISSFEYSDEAENPLVRITHLSSEASMDKDDVITIHTDVKSNSTSVKYGVDQIPMVHHLGDGINK